MNKETKAYQNKMQYDMNYIKNNCKQVKLLLNKVHDQDIIEHLQKQSNTNGYLKELIRKDMSK